MANKIMSLYTNELLPKSVNRKGDNVDVTLYDDINSLLSIFENKIKPDVVHISKSVGIICYTPEIYSLVEALFEKMPINKSDFIKLDKTKKVYYVPKGVYLMKVDDCKGLEFSKVYVLGLNTSKIDNIENARKAFVSVTRAMNELILMGLK